MATQSRTQSLDCPAAREIEWLWDNHKSMFMVTPLDIRVLKIIVTNKNRNNRDLCQE